MSKQGGTHEHAKNDKNPKLSPKRGTSESHSQATVSRDNDSEDFPKTDNPKKAVGSLEAQKPPSQPRS